VLRPPQFQHTLARGGLTRDAGGVNEPVNRLATPLPDSVLDRYFNDPEYPERLAEDPRRRREGVGPTLPLEWDEGE
jgi:hypothetical protein